MTYFGYMIAVVIVCALLAAMLLGCAVTEFHRQLEELQDRRPEELNEAIGEDFV